MTLIGFAGLATTESSSNCEEIKMKILLEYVTAVLNILGALYKFELELFNS